MHRPTLRRGTALALEQHQTATVNFISVNGARVRRTGSINAALIRPAFFSTARPAPSAESELMLYPCTIRSVNSSFDHDNPRPTPRVFDGGSRPRAAVAGCAGVMSSTSMVMVMALALATAAVRRRRMPAAVAQAPARGKQRRRRVARDWRVSNSQKHERVEDSGIAVSAPESPYTFTFGRPKRVGLDLKFSIFGSDPDSRRPVWVWRLCSGWRTARMYEILRYNRCIWNTIFWC
jgi:hypothetical protein